MKKAFKIGLIVTFTLLLNLAGFAQQSEKFDIISFKTPTGWQKEVSENGVQLGGENSIGGSCLITVFKSVTGSDDSKVNFDAAWETIVQDNFTLSSDLQMQPSSNENGWITEYGVARYESDGKAGVALLVTITGNSRMLNILILTNTDAFEKEMTDFLDSIKFNETAKKIDTKTSKKAQSAILRRDFA